MRMAAVASASFSSSLLSFHNVKLFHFLGWCFHTTFLSVCKTNQQLGAMYFTAVFLGCIELRRWWISHSHHSSYSSATKPAATLQTKTWNLFLFIGQIGKKNISKRWFITQVTWTFFFSQQKSNGCLTGHTFQNIHRLDHTDVLK